MQTTMKASFKTKLALVITILLWASAFPGIRAGLTGYSPGGLALLRFLIASLCLYLIYWRLPAQRCLIQMKDALLLVVIGAVTIGGYHVALNYGELTVPSGEASFIISQAPIVTVIFAAIFLKEQVNKTMIFGILISVFGIALITLQKQEFSWHVGFFCILFSAITGGIYTVLQKPFLKKYHAIDVTAYIVWGATLFLLVFTPDLYRDLGKASFYATAAVVYLGIFPAAIAYALWTYVLIEIPASRASISMYFLPVVTIFVAWLWLGEVPTSISIIGGMIALMGVWLVNHSYRSLPKVEIISKRPVLEAE